MSDEESTEYYTLLCDDPSHEVVLVDCEPREMDVIRAVRKVTGLSLWHSRVLARQAPVTLLRGCLRTGPSPLSPCSRAPAPERSGDRSRSPESAWPRRPDVPATAQR